MKYCYVTFVFQLLCVSYVYCKNLQDFPTTRMGLINTSKNTSAVFRVGLMGYFINNDASPGVARFAVERVNNDLSMIPNVNLQLYFCQTDGSKTQALQASETLISQYNVGTIIGARTSDETEISNIVASFHNVPQIGAVTLSPTLSEKKFYPYFLRVNPPAQYQNAAILNLIRYYGWGQVFVMYSNDPYGIAGFSNLQAQTTAAGDNVSFYSTQVVGGSKNHSELIATMNDIIAQTRVRIFIVYTQSNDALVILKQIYEAGLMGNTTNNAFILTNAIGVGFVMQQFNISAYPFLHGAITLTARAAVAGDLLDELNSEWRSANSTLFPGARYNPTQEWYYYDAVYTIAHALDNMLKVKPLENITGAELLATMLASNFTGVTGQMGFDSHSDRIGDYVYYNLKDTFQKSFSEIAAIYSPVGLNITMNPSYPLTFHGKIKQPDGICPCVNGICDDNDVCNCHSDWGGKSCNVYTKAGNEFDTKDYVLVTVIPVFFFVVILVVAVQLVKRKRKALIKDMAQKQRSLIKRGDITLQNRIGRGASGEVFKGMFRGTEVAVKKVSTGTSSVITEQFEMECAIMTALRHPNIVMFMGMCLVPEQGELLLVMELMEKGSLHDILHNVYSKIQFTQTLCLHIAYQAAKGMNFLHQSDPPIIHCDLKSHNILMDDKWNARISDFGITKFKKLKEKKAEKPKEGNGISSIGTIYWTAPEVFAGQKHIEASDCYSFGIVLWELFHREVPYGGKEPMLVANEVQNGARPRLRDDLSPDIKCLIMDCWAQDPAARPTFETIMNRLRILNTHNPLAAIEAQARSNIEAPSGTVYFVATEVVNSNDLWNDAPIAMCEAMKMHNQYIRHKLETLDGYEIKCNLNGFLLAFRNIKAAIDFCLASQIELLSLNWPKKLLEHPGASIQREGSTLLFAGLRVRMAVHAGVPNCHTDQLGRMQYVGPVVERTKKLLYCTSNCSIITSNIIMEHATTKGVRFAEETSVATLGEVLDSARGANSSRNKSDQVFDVLPVSLEHRRNFRTEVEELDPAIPNAIVVDVDTKQQSKILFNIEKSSGLPWVAALADLTEKDKVGRGAIGDYIRSVWKGKEVLQKVLVNQQISENDILILKAHASVLVKVQHKNLLPFYGVCLEPDHTSLLIQYVPKAPCLTVLLKDNTVPLSFPVKVKLAKQIADGMAHLSTMHDHPWLATFGNLKSGNVLVEKDTMNVKIADFGQGNLKDLARTMTSVGTVAWTAPELLNDEDATPKIAQYSFGIILWEIYTRHFPYYDEHPIKVVTKIVAGHRPPVPGDCPEKYKELMVQCWDNDPNKRPGWGEIIAILSSL